VSVEPPSGDPKPIPRPVVCVGLVVVAVEEWGACPEAGGATPASAVEVGEFEVVIVIPPPSAIPPFSETAFLFLFLFFLPTVPPTAPPMTAARMIIAAMKRKIRPFVVCQNGMYLGGLSLALGSSSFETRAPCSGSAVATRLGGLGEAGTLR